MSRGELIAWIAAAALLICVLVYVNAPAKHDNPAEDAVIAETAEEQEGEETEDAEEALADGIPVGSEVGMRLPDFTAPVYGGTEFASADCRGKITVINFWATWCTPCVNELPHFERLAAEFDGEVEVAALHSSLITEDVEAWLERESYNLRFALDETGGIIESLGGSTMLPMTVVVNADGIIVYNAVGSVTYEKLLEIIELAK